MCYKTSSIQYKTYSSLAYKYFPRQSVSTNIIPFSMDFKIEIEIIGCKTQSDSSERVLTGIGSRLVGARLEGMELTLVQGRDLPGCQDIKGG